MTETVAYCADCDWVRRTGDGATRRDLDRAMIDHYVASGHSLVEALEAENVDDAVRELDVDLVPVCEPAESSADGGDPVLTTDRE